MSEQNQSDKVRISGAEIKYLELWNQDEKIKISGAEIVYLEITNQNISNQIKIQKIFSEIEKKSASDDYIYRGEPKDYGKVSSNLYRKYKNFGLNIEEVIEDVQAEDLEEAKQYTNKTDKCEILSELQHYGGQTNLIDFTTDYHIAIFFACDQSPDEDGRFILQKKANHAVYKPQFPEKRVKAQQSIFVIPDAGYIEPADDDIVPIPARLKQPLLNYLKNHKDISKETLYKDIHGFIKYQAIHRIDEIAFYRGLTDQNAGEYEQAIKHYTNAITINPDFADAYLNRGVVKNSLGQHKKAIEDYDKAIRLNPDYSNAYGSRGIAKQNLERYEEAIKDYDEAIKRNPNFVEFYHGRGVAKCGLDRYEDALTDFDKFIQLKPNYAYEPYFYRGFVKNKLDKPKEAIEDYNEAIILNPEFAEAYFNRGLSYLEINQPEEARRDLETAHNLAQQAGNESLAAAADLELRNLDAPDEDE